MRAPGGRTAYLSELKSGCEVVVVDSEGREAVAVVGRVKIEARPLVLVEAVTSEGDTLSVLLQNAETVKLVGPAVSPAQQDGMQRGPNGGAGEWGEDREVEVQEGAEQPPGGQAASSADDPAPPASCSLNMKSGGGSASHAPGEGAPGGAQNGGGARSIGDGVSSSSTRTDECTAAVQGGRRMGAWRAISVSTLKKGDQVLVLPQPAARHTGMSVNERVKEV